MATDDDDNTRRDPQPRNRRDADDDRDDDDDDPVLVALIEKRRGVAKVAKKASDDNLRESLDNELVSLDHQINEQRRRKARPDAIPGDPYGRTDAELANETARLGAHH
jgi:hypothetical protein